MVHPSTFFGEITKTNGCNKSQHTFDQFVVVNLLCNSSNAPLMNLSCVVNWKECKPTTNQSEKFDLNV